MIRTSNVILDGCWIVKRKFDIWLCQKWGQLKFNISNELWTMHPRLCAHSVRLWLEPCPPNLYKSWPIFKQMHACGSDQFIAIKKRNHDTKFAESSANRFYENPLEIISILFGPWAKRCSHRKFFLVNAKTVNGINVSIQSTVCPCSQLSSSNYKTAMVHFMIFMDSISKSLVYLSLSRCTRDISTNAHISQLLARCVKYIQCENCAHSSHSSHECRVFSFVCFHFICIKFSYTAIFPGKM